MKEKLIELVHSEASTAAEVHTHILQMEEHDIAEAFDDLDTAKAVKLFRLLPKNIAADVFAHIDTDVQQTIIETITDKEQAAIINDLFADDAVDLIEEMPAGVVRRLLKNASPEVRDDINFLLKYPEGSAGSIMTVEYIRLKQHHTVKHAFDIIHEHGVNKKSIYTCFVTDDKKTLIGFVSVRDLLLAKPSATIGELMTSAVIHLHTTDDQEHVADQFKKYGFMSMPVVDSEDKLVGVITVDDVLHVIEEEHTEDISKMAGLKPLETSYLKASVLRHSRNRIMWLMILLVSAFLTGSVISGFENALVAMPILMVFIPMLMDTAGNAGSQSSAQIIRSMALGEITPKIWLNVLWKEVRVALLCGLGMGIVVFGRIMLLDNLAFQSTITDGINQAFGIACTVTLALCITVLIAKVLGCLFPILAKLVRIDPALMAAPLITTIADVLSLLVYFGLATLFLTF